jgi:2-oxoglutarate ferredoxin oxidoreductase subunit delta
MADKKKGRIKINSELCKGCYLCISVCPKQVISVSETLNHQGYYPSKSTDSSDDPKCTGCAMCATMCPDVAIEVYRD